MAVRYILLFVQRNILFVISFNRKSGRERAEQREGRGRGRAMKKDPEVQVRKQNGTVYLRHCSLHTSQCYYEVECSQSFVLPMENNSVEGRRLSPSSVGCCTACICWLNVLILITSLVANCGSHAAAFKALRVQHVANWDPVDDVTIFHSFTVHHLSSSYLPLSSSCLWTQKVGSYMPVNCLACFVQRVPVPTLYIPPFLPHAVHPFILWASTPLFSNIVALDGYRSAPVQNASPHLSCLLHTHTSYKSFYINIECIYFNFDAICDFSPTLMFAAAAILLDDGENV